MMKDKVAIITASSTGIGKAIAKRLGKEGCRVVISSRNQEHVNQAMAELREEGHEVAGIVCHVGKREDLKKLVEFTIEQFGRLDYLVCNAAVTTHTGNFLTANESQIRKMWEINYFSAFYLVQEAMPHLKKQKNSSIILHSSLSAYYTPLINGHYAMTKLAMVAMGKALSKALYKDGIRVNTLATGFINTKYSQPIQHTKNKVNVDRIGQPEEVANVTKFLLSEEASYVNGESIIIGGKAWERL